MKIILNPNGGISTCEVKAVINAARRSIFLGFCITLISIGAPWTDLPHLDKKIYLLEFKLAFGLGATLVLFVWYLWLRLVAWRANAFFWMHILKGVPLSVLPLISAVFCATKGAQSFIFGVWLVVGWLIVVVGFGLFATKDVVEGKGGIDQNGAYDFKEMENPALDYAKKEHTFEASKTWRIINAVSFVLIGASSLIGSWMLNEFNDEPHVINSVVLIVNYLCALVFSLAFFIGIAGLLECRAWERKHGRPVYIKGFEHRIPPKYRPPSV